jgi:hypothetical protein
MAEGIKNWLLRQWRDIKGNTKTAILFTLGVSVMDWFRNGPAWQVFGVFTAVACSLFLLLWGANHIHKRIGWVLLIFGVVVSTLSVVSHEIKRFKATSAIPPGSMQQSAILVGTGTVQQAGRDINIGASPLQIADVYKLGIKDGLDRYMATNSNELVKDWRVKRSG